MAAESKTSEDPDVRYVDVLLGELESLIDGSRLIPLIGQVRVDGSEAKSLIQSIRDALADERSGTGS